MIILVAAVAALAARGPTGRIAIADWLSSTSSRFAVYDLKSRKWKMFDVNGLRVDGIAAGRADVCYGMDRTAGIFSKIWLRDPPIARVVARGDVHRVSREEASGDLAVIKDHEIWILRRASLRPVARLSDLVENLSPPYDNGWYVASWVARDKMVAGYNDPFLRPARLNEMYLVWAKGGKKPVSLGFGIYPQSSESLHAVAYETLDYRKVVLARLIYGRLRRFATLPGEAEYVFDPSGRYLAVFRGSKLTYYDVATMKLLGASIVPWFPMPNGGTMAWLGGPVYGRV